MKSKEEISYIALEVYKTVEKLLYDYKVNANAIDSILKDIEEFIVERITDCQE